MNNKITRKLIRIIEHCESIESDVKYFGKDEEEFDSNEHFRKCVIMSMIQIGECVKQLPKEFTSTHTDVEWDSIARFRDFCTHKYDYLSSSRVWEYVTMDIPTLKDRCKSFLNENEQADSDCQSQRNIL